MQFCFLMHYYKTSFALAASVLYWKMSACSFSCIAPMKINLFEWKFQTKGHFLLDLENAHLIVLYVLITAPSELCKVLFLALWLFCLCMKYLRNRWTHLRRIHRTDMFGPSFGRVNIKVKGQGHHGQKNWVFGGYLGNHWSDLRQIHTEDMFGPSHGRVWRSRLKVKVTRDKNQQF